MSSIKVVSGATGVLWTAAETASQVLQVLEEEGIHNIDTAAIYGTEELMGKLGAAKKFVVDTKHPGGFGGENVGAKENVLKVAARSLELLQTDQVDVYYLHAPERSTPLEQTLEGINEVYKKGAFKRFGLSNFLPSEVEEVLRITKEKGFVQPTVYQGNYSAVARKQEVQLFPLLRKHGIAFYAYSPLAGGFLTKKAAQFTGESGANTGPRFDGSSPVGKIYTSLYNKPAFLDALAKWEAISNDSGIPKAELAYRWVAHNSPLKKEHGDAVIVGASKVEQLRQTLQSIKKGPLDEKVVKQIDQVWDGIKHEAGLDNFNLNSA